VRTIVWSVRALEEYRGAVSYIAQDDKFAAQALANRLDAAVQLLSEMPIGRAGRIAGTYEKLVLKTPYVIAYALDDEPQGDGAITILRIVHGARNWHNDR